MPTLPPDRSAEISAHTASTAGLFELLTLVGYYAALALQLRVFRVPAPDGTAPPS